MRRPVAFILSLFTILVAVPTRADDSGSFIVRLGRDTTGFERYTRTPSQVVVEQVGLAPRVLLRRFTYDYLRGEIARVGMVVTRPGSDTPTQTIEGSFGPDSARVRIQSANAPTQNVALVVPKDAVVIAGSSPWVGYEWMLMRFVKQGGDSLRSSLYVLGGNATSWVTARRLGRDSIAITNGRNERYHVRADAQGRVIGVASIAGTGRYSVERIAGLDLPALTADFASREQAGAGVGTLSPRDSVVITAGGASLWIDYGRPGKRGRVIFGDVVPYGQVWRTGANAASQFRTDKALDFGGTIVPAGLYTLWAVPAPGGWTLRFNGETGQWGTAHKPDRDLHVVGMKAASLPAAVERFTISVEPSSQGGVLHMDWDATRASAAFTVKP